MQLGLSTANAAASALAALWNGGTLQVFAAGSKPVAADDPVTATPLLTMTLPIQAFTAPANGVLQLAGTWFATVTAAGTASWFRIADPSGSTNAVGLVSTVSVSGELTLSSNALAVGQVVKITAFQFTVPTGS